MIQVFAFATIVHALTPSQPFVVQFGAAAMGQPVTYCLDGRKVESGFAGKLNFRDASHSWQSVCGAVRHPVMNGQYFPVRVWNTQLLGNNVTIAGNIVAKYFNSARTAEQCAGLQLAVWEAVEDGGKQPDFAGGYFQARASQGAMGWAAQYYQAAGDSGNAAYLQTGDGGGQSQFTTRV
jgi:hypothetical protein